MLNRFRYVGVFLCAVLCAFAALVFATGACAQTNVTGTFLTPNGKTPQAANLTVLATVANTPVCGKAAFVAYDAVGNKVIRLLWNNVTYFPQKVTAYIRCSDGALISSAGTIGVSLVPNSDAAPANTVYQLVGSLTASSDGSISAAAWSEEKSIPDQLSVDWSSLPVASVVAPPTLFPIIGSGAVNFDLENPATSDSGTFEWEPKNGVTLTRLSCSVDVGTVSINLDVRTESAPNISGTQMLSTPLVCSPTTGQTSTFVASIPAQSPVALLITSTSGTPGVVRVHMEFGALSLP